MSWSPIGVYRPGTTVLHRMRPGTKLLSLIILAVALMWVREWWMTIAILVLVIGVVLLAKIPLSLLFRSIRGFLIIAVILFALHVWQRDLTHAVVVVGALLTLIIASVVVTQTTRSADMVDTITWALGPLHVVGVSSGRIALAFSLTLAAIPTLLSLAHETQAAARARGLERNLRAYATPLVIRSVLHARLLGEALEARGIDEY